MKKLGRPIGPSPDRGSRPWDPETLRSKEKIILKYVVCNAHLPRYRVAKHLGISQSYLSVLTCSELGIHYQDHLMSTLSIDQIRPFIIH